MCQVILYQLGKTGYLRADLHPAQIIWKIQRELVKAAGFELMRGNFW